MKTNFLLLLLFPVLLNAQNMNGKVIEKVKIPSAILKKDINCSVYFPPDYDISNRSYPVLYLLHGYTDDETAWVQFGEVNSTADKAIQNKEIAPMIIVMPDAGVTWYMNDIKGEERYEDMFINELIPYVDKTYRTRAQKEFRAIGGLSMGGLGSLLYSMKYPDLFSSCIAYSAAVRTNEVLYDIPDNDFKNVFGKILGEKPKNKNSFPKQWTINNPVDLAKTLDVEKLNTVSFYLDCGDDDFLKPGNCILSNVMTERKINHELRFRDGDHNWTYWRTYIIDGLKYISKRFHQF